MKGDARKGYGGSWSSFGAPATPVDGLSGCYLFTGLWFEIVGKQNVWAYARGCGTAVETPRSAKTIHSGTMLKWLEPR